MKKGITGLLKSILFISLFSIANPSWAQGPGDGGLAPTAPPATDIPIDGGASLLLAGGVAFGLKKLRDRKRNH